MNGKREREVRLAALEEARQIAITEREAWKKLDRWLAADAADNCEIGIRALIQETEAALSADAPGERGAQLTGEPLRKVCVALHRAIDHAVYGLPTSDEYVDALRDAKTIALEARAALAGGEESNGKP